MCVFDWFHLPLAPFVMLAVVGRIKLLLTGVFRPPDDATGGDERRAVILAAALFSLDGLAAAVLLLCWMLVAGNVRNDGDGLYRMVALVVVGSRDRLPAVAPRNDGGDLIVTVVEVGFRIAPMDAPMLDPLELLRLAGARIVVLFVGGRYVALDGTVADRV